MKFLRLFFIAWFVAASASAAEVIRDFHSQIVVATNAEMTVTETIRVVAEGNQIKHGIYRDFPNLYHSKWGLHSRTGFKVVSVKRDGKDEPWHTASRENGVRVYIGDKNTVVSRGEHVYELTYETNRPLGFFADHDELYWNVTGNGWEFAIEKASAEVRLPDGVGIGSREAYTGLMGSKGRNYTTGIEATAANVATFETTKRLGQYEGLTIVVTWPKNLIHAAIRSDDPWVIAKDNPGVALGVVGLIAVLFYYFSVWAMFGKDPSRGTIVPLFEPPRGYSPAAVRELTKMRYDTKAFAANVLNLAVKGALTISKHGKTFAVTYRADVSDELLPDEKAMCEKLLGTRHRMPYGGATLPFTPSNHQIIKGAQNALKLKLATMLERTHFVKNVRFWLTGLSFSLVPLLVSLIDTNDLAGTIFLFIWISFWSVGVTVMLAGAVFMLWKKQFVGGLFLGAFSIPFVGAECMTIKELVHCSGPWVAGVFVIGVVMNGIFYYLLKAPTMAGRRILDQIEGFKLFLAVSEKDRLNFENPPEKTPELFDKFLPYAFALDVDQKWAAQFSDVLAQAGRADMDGDYRPDWYSGPAFAAAGFDGFASSLGSSLSGAISSASSPPGSDSGSSGGGSDGGGSSGGGGGGGGGGGW